MKKRIRLFADVTLSLAALTLACAGRAQSDRSIDRSITPAKVVQDAYDAVARRQAALAMANDTREKLVRLKEVDQAGRQVLSRLRINDLPEPERPSAWAAVWAVINRYDLECQRQLKLLMPPNAWFRSSVVGKDGATAAFMVVQHAVNDPQLMRFVARKIADYVQQGDASGSSLALITDRIALEFDHKSQTYGTQVSCVDGRWSATDVIDPEHLDERRRRVGLDAESAYLKDFDDAECPSATPAAPQRR